MPFYPPLFPHDLSKKPRLLGESLVYEALGRALPAHWHVFYDQPAPGTRRRIDFLCVDPDRGAVAFEVKGGMVHKTRARLVQVVRKDGIRKTIDPFAQLKQAVEAVLRGHSVDPAAVPLHLSVFVPQMSARAYTFGEGAHFFTREHLDPPRLWAKITAQLPPRCDPTATATFQQFVTAMSRAGFSLPLPPRTAPNDRLHL